MSKRPPQLLISDILESSRKITAYTKGMTFEQFSVDEKTIDAVIRNFEIIGEAANKLPEEFRDEWPVIEWQRVRGFRNRIVHDYAGIDLTIVWQIKETYLPEMTAQIENISGKLS